MTPHYIEPKYSTIFFTTRCHYIQESSTSGFELGLKTNCTKTQGLYDKNIPQYGSEENAFCIPNGNNSFLGWVFKANHSQYKN